MADFTPQMMRALSVDLLCDRYAYIPAEHALAAVAALARVRASRAISGWVRLDLLPEDVDEVRGCHHCGADPIEVRDFCPCCALPVCGACLSEATEFSCNATRAVL